MAMESYTVRMTRKVLKGLHAETDKPELEAVHERVHDLIDLTRNGRLGSCDYDADHTWLEVQ